MKEQWKAGLMGAVIGIGGLVAGMQLAGQPAAAQSRGYTQCFFAQQEVEDTNDDGRVSGPASAHLIVVPSGYEVVSGGGNGRVDHGTILFCRR